MRCYIYLAQNGYYYRHCDADPKKIFALIFCLLAVVALAAIFVWLFDECSHNSNVQIDTDSIIYAAKQRLLDAKKRYEQMEEELEDTIHNIKDQWLNKHR